MPYVSQQSLLTQGVMNLVVSYKIFCRSSSGDDDDEVENCALSLATVLDCCEDKEKIYGILERCLASISAVSFETKFSPYKENERIKFRQALHQNVTYFHPFVRTSDLINQCAIVHIAPILVRMKGIPLTQQGIQFIEERYNYAVNLSQSSDEMRKVPYIDMFDPLFEEGCKIKLPAI